jgi:hypothetical protein
MPTLNAPWFDGVREAKEAGKGGRQRRQAKEAGKRQDFVIVRAEVKAHLNQPRLFSSSAVEGGNMALFDGWAG